MRCHHINATECHQSSHGLSASMCYDVQAAIGRRCAFHSPWYFKELQNAALEVRRSTLHICKPARGGMAASAWRCRMRKSCRRERQAYEVATHKVRTCISAFACLRSPLVLYM